MSQTSQYVLSSLLEDENEYKDEYKDEYSDGEEQLSFKTVSREIGKQDVSVSSVSNIFANKLRVSCPLCGESIARTKHGIRKHRKSLSCLKIRYKIKYGKSLELDQLGQQIHGPDESNSNSNSLFDRLFLDDQLTWIARQQCMRLVCFCARVLCVTLWIVFIIVNQNFVFFAFVYFSVCLDYTCPLCMDLFDSRRKLLIHKNAKHDEKELKMEFVCHLCDKEFGTKLQLKIHKKTDHKKNGQSGLKNYQCDQCDKKFQSISEKTRHIKMIHEGDDVTVCKASKRFVCCKCLKPFTRFVYSQCVLFDV